MNNMTIGERIKELRKKNDLTQEKLADYLCISYQAVSKWECGITSPDLSFIAPLTKLLHVTADELLGLKTTGNEARLAEIEATYKETWKTGDLEKRYKIASTAVAEYPGEMKYLDWLAWAEALRSFNYKDDDTYKAEQEKAIKHFACVIENTVDERVKASSIQGIVQYLSFRGRYDEAKKYALLYPDHYTVNKDDVLLNCLQGEEKTEFYQKMLDGMLTDILNFIGNNSLLSCNAQEEILKALIPDENYLHYHYFLAEIYLGRARLYTSDGNFDRAIGMLETAHHHAVKYDKFMNENIVYHFSSPFFDKVKINPSDICRTGTTSEEDAFFEALKQKSFDPLRNYEKFKNIVENLVPSAPF